MPLVASESLLLECCSCRTWAAAVAGEGPYASLEELISSAREAWWHQTSVAGWLEAFAAHPKIGDMESLRKKYGGFAALSKGEQAAAGSASPETLQELAAWNTLYEGRFGHIFIICASGKSAEEMLAAVKARYPNDPHSELLAAAVEQQKITELRLHRVFGGSGAASSSAERRAGQVLTQLVGRQRAEGSAAAAAAPPQRPNVTTHVLDTSMGRPAEGVRVVLRRLAPGSSGAWEPVAAGQTNKDGRIPDLLPAGERAPPGHYRITFDTSDYMQRCKAAHPGFFADTPFYPSVSVEFQILASQMQEHFHVPLTWNPYGYSTYRGS